MAIPALIAGVSEPILSLTDAAIVGNIQINATESLAAVGIVTTFLSMLIWVLGQTRSAISSIVSQHVGANKLEQIKNLPAQAIFIITSLSILLIITTYPFAKQIFKLYNASHLILDYTVIYYKIRVLGFPFTLFTIAIFGVFRGLQNMLAIRRNNPIFGASRTTILDTDNQHCFAYVRENDSGEKLLAICNFSEETQQINGNLLGALGHTPSIDLLTGNTLNDNNTAILLAPFQQYWLKQ